jgi:hypothetical protein
MGEGKDEGLIEKEGYEAWGKALNLLNPGNLSNPGHFLVLVYQLVQFDTGG